MKISIVTACFNRRALIGDAIRSVVAQDHADVEHIVIDGGSTDGTVEYLERFPHLRVVSEPDDGIYDAWNKGLALCTGDVIGILNSDDLYGPGVFREVCERFREQPRTQVITGRALQFAERDEATWRVVHEYHEAAGPVLDPGRLIFWGPIINARFFRADLIRRVGEFERRYSIASDCDFMLRLARGRPAAVYLDRFVYYYRSHPGSVSLNEHGASEVRSYSEKLSIAEEWLHGGLLSPPDRVTVRDRHAELSAIATLGFLRRGAFGQAAAFMRRGLALPGSFLRAIAAEGTRILAYQVRKRRHGGVERTIAPVVHGDGGGAAGVAGPGNGG